MARSNTPSKKDATIPPMSDHDMIEKLKQKKAEDMRKKRREATKKCRQKQKDELAALEERKKAAINQNKVLLERIAAIEELIKWMQNAMNARQRYAESEAAATNAQPYGNIPCYSNVPHIVPFHSYTQL